MNHIPIIGALLGTAWPDWREAFKELFIILLFSLMPVWLGLLMVTILTITDSSAVIFLTKFASSSDLGILSASLLGPLLYMMFRDDGGMSGERLIPSFPSGLWFTVLIFISCVVATVLYCFTYLSEVGSFFDKSGALVHFVNSFSVARISWILFFTSTLLVLFASAIRNSMDSRAPHLMSIDTQDYVEKMQAEQVAVQNPNPVNADTQNFVDQLRAQQGDDHETPA